MSRPIENILFMILTLILQEKCQKIYVNFEEIEDLINPRRLYFICNLHAGMQYLTFKIQIKYYIPILWQNQCPNTA